jgi:hypothetical protein
LRQDHLVVLPGRDPHPEVRQHHAGRRRPCPVQRAGADPVPPTRGRPGLPGVQVAGQPDRPGERRGAIAPGRPRPGHRAGAGRGVAYAVRIGRAHGKPAGDVVRWPAAAGRDRPRVGPRPAVAAGRRTHRGPGLRPGGDGDPDLARPGSARPDRGRLHARPSPGSVGRSGDQDGARGTDHRPDAGPGTAERGQRVVRPR